jgi:hypothetical protein
MDREGMRSLTGFNVRQKVRVKNIQVESTSVELLAAEALFLENCFLQRCGGTFDENAGGELRAPLEIGRFGSPPREAVKKFGRARLLPSHEAPSS